GVRVKQNPPKREKVEVTPPAGRQLPMIRRFRLKRREGGMRRAWLAALTAGSLTAGAARADGPVWVTPVGGTAPVWQPATTPQPPPRPTPPDTIPRQNLPPAPKEAYPPAPATPTPTAVPPAPQTPPQPELCLEPPPGGVMQAGVLLPARRGVVGSPSISLSR